MSVEISFCPVCAGKLDSEEDEQFVCGDCETEFFIQIVGEGDEDEDEDEEKEKDDEEEDEDEDEYGEEEDEEGDDR